MAAFSQEKFKRVWDALPEKTREEIRHKARWEQMTLSAVMREWWPRLWAQIEVKETDDGRGRGRRGLSSVR